MALGTITKLTNSLSSFIRSLKAGQKWTLRAAAVLTTSYVNSDHMPCDVSATVGFWITYAAVDYTSIEVRYEASYDGTTWFSLPMRQPIVTAAAGYPTSSWVDGFVLADFPSATTWRIFVPIAVAAGVRYVRVSIKRTGGSAVGTVLVEGIEGGNS